MSERNEIEKSIFDVYCKTNNQARLGKLASSRIVELFDKLDLLEQRISKLEDKSFPQKIIEKIKGQ